MCHDDDSHPPIPLSDGAEINTRDLRITAADGEQYAAYLAEPVASATAQIVILPDARGLHNFYKELAQRFAEVGTRALAIDYFARTAENDDRTEPFDYMAHINLMTPLTFGFDLEAALEEIRRGPGQDLPTFTVGFCMGGSLSLWAGTREDRAGRSLSGVIGFYASLTRSFGAVTPAVEWAKLIRCPVLGLFGGADQGIPRGDVDRFEHELEEVAIPHEIVVYPGAPHSFFDRKATDFAAAAADAWTRVQGFIASHTAVRV